MILQTSSRSFRELGSWPCAFSFLSNSVTLGAVTLMKRFLLRIPRKRPKQANSPSLFLSRRRRRRQCYRLTGLHRYLGDVTKGVLPGYASLKTLCICTSKPIVQRSRPQPAIKVQRAPRPFLQGNGCNLWACDIKTGKYTHSSGVVIKLLAFLCWNIKSCYCTGWRGNERGETEDHHQQKHASRAFRCGCIQGCATLWLREAFNTWMPSFAKYCTKKHLLLPRRDFVTGLRGKHYFVVFCANPHNVGWTYLMKSYKHSHHKYVKSVMFI